MSPPPPQREIKMYENQVWCCCFSAAVLHGNNLLVFGGTGIPFGENNGNDVHVCNVKYKRWSLLNCRGKKPNRIYGQVATEISHPPRKMCTLNFCFSVLSAISYFLSPGNGYYKRLPVRVWRDDRLYLQHRPTQAGPDHKRVDPP